MPVTSVFQPKFSSCHIFYNKLTVPDIRMGKVDTSRLTPFVNTNFTQQILQSYLPHLISSFGSTIIFPHSSHLVTSNGSYTEKKTLLAN